MTSTGSETKSLPDTVIDISMQENVSPRAHAPRQSKQQIRHRASVACASCRDRRIRCVVPKGSSECTQCKRSGTECVIKNDDERRRPISKAYMSSLSERINLLEAMLKNQGVQPPPAVHPPKTRQEVQAKQQQQQQQQPNQQSDGEQQKYQPDDLQSIQQSAESQGFHSPHQEVPSPPDSYNDDFTLHDQDHSDGAMTTSQTFQPMMKEPSPFRNLDPRKEDIVHRLLSTKGNLSFDQLSGRLRFFGPTANSHVYAESPDQFDTREPAEQVRRAERIIRSLSQETHDYLMSCFWDYYNSVLQVIDRAAFEADRDSQNPKFYSSFLHITILAGGYRFADLSREDIVRISLGNRESTFHRESKYMLDIELERPGGIPSVQALLILGDMECGVGRDNTGWMYAGMANRLAFDIGLHLDCRGDSIPETEVQIRHRVMRACVLYDKYWALFLGRPTSIKSQDIGMDLLNKKFSMLTADTSMLDSRKMSKATDAEVHEQLIELMEIAGKIVESRDHKLSRSTYEPSTTMFGSNETEDNAYMQVISLDRQLQNWYRRLPDHLTWKPANIKAAPFSFFLLHQQYHVSMILLHRPWAKYGSITSSDGSSTNSHPSPDAAGQQQHHQNQQPQAASAGSMTANMHMSSITGHALGLGDPQALVDDSRTSLSRSICTQQAIRVARIFWQHRQRYDSRKICVTGIQHAGTAAIALIAALAHQQTSDPDRRSYLSYLEILSAAISDMAHTYQPAARMDDLLKAILVQLRSDVDDSTTFRASAVLHNFHPPSATAGAAAGGGIPNGAGSAGGGASVMFSPTLGWNASPDNIYSMVVPQRREHPASASSSVGGGGADAATTTTTTNGATAAPPASKKQRRPGTGGGGLPARRASEFTRPRPPFFKSGGGGGGGGGAGSGAAVLTPPGSFAVLPHPHHPHPHHHHAASVSSAVMGPPPASLFDGSNGFGLDFLSGAAAAFEAEDEAVAVAHAAAAATAAGGAGEDYVLVTPTSDGWGLGGGLDGQHHAGAGYEVSMTEWMSSSGPGPGGLGAAVKEGAAGGGGGGGGGASVKGDGEEGGLSTSLGSHHSERSGGGIGAATGNGAAGGGAKTDGGMEWMGSEGGMNALSPVSLSGLVQSVEKAAGANGSAEQNGNGAARNHELDFFAF